jgi:hypothetical protein
MATAITALANVTLGANASTITFSSISQSYRDLIFVLNLKSTTSTDSVFFKVNGLTSLYGYNLLDGSNTTINANTTFNTSSLVIDQNYPSIASATFNSGTMYMADYSATDRRKNVFIKNANQYGYQLVLNGARTPSTAAVTSIVFGMSNWQFAAGSSIALYGVSA